MTHNMALCAIPLPHCHADCYSAPRIRAGSQRASLQASFTPTPPLRWFGSLVGASSPGPRPSPRCSSPLPSPRGDCAPRSASVFADSSDARLPSAGGAATALLCSTLTRPPAAFVAGSRQPPHARRLAFVRQWRTASVLIRRTAITMPPCVAAADRVTTPSLLE